MAKQLRVLQLIDSLARAGAEQSLATLAPHLAAEGVEVHVAYLVERDGLRPDLEQAGIPVHSLADGHNSRRGWLAATGRLINDLQPAVVHTTLFEADLAGRRAAAKLGTPCVSSFVNTAYGRTETSSDGLRRLRVLAAQAADAYTARLVTRFHAVTRHVAGVMTRRLLVPRDKVDVIPRGRDGALLGRRADDRRIATRRRLGIPDDTRLILAVGRQEPQKGFDVLLRALPGVRHEIPDVQVLVAGREGRATPALAQLVATEALDGVVHFLGMRDDVPDLMVAADVLAFPSLWEGAAGTLQEAMALECPIVTSDLSTIEETVDQSTATLVPPGSAEGLADGLAVILNSPEASHAKAKAARERFERNFTIQACAQRMADFYARCASG